MGELGKDIITRRSDETVVAYQLKSGDINKPQWRSIQGEVVELIELPVQYPTPLPKGMHIPVLVTNGSVSEDVRITIQAMNDGNASRGFNPLIVVEGKELLSDFVTAHGQFLPTAPQDISAFMELLMNDGRANLDKSKFTSFIHSIFSISKVSSKVELLRAVTSAMLFAKYAIKNHEESANHVSVCEAWSILLAETLYHCEDQGIPPPAFDQTVLLIFEQILSSGALLRDELLSDRTRFIEGSPVGDGGLMYSMRLTMSFGWVSALEVAKKIASSKHVSDPKVTERFEANLPFVGIWGEAAVPYMFAISLLLRTIGHQKQADALGQSILEGVVFANNARNRAGLASPYCLPDALLDSYFDVPEAQIDMGEFAGSSYTMRALVDHLVRVNRRDLLTPLWKSISFTRSREYYPAKPRDYLLWNSHDGTERDFGYDLPTSWDKLRTTLPTDSELPEGLRSYPWFAAIFMIVYPHRFRRDLLSLFDSVLV